MKDVQIDTAQIISALGVLLEPDKYSLDKDHCNLIDFISQIIVRNKVFYDGKVHGDQKKLLDKFYNKISELLGQERSSIFQRSLEAIEPPESIENDLAIDAGTKAAQVASAIAFKRDELKPFIEGYNTLKGTSQLDSCLEKYLLPHFDGKGPDPDTIKDDKNIIGRRYIFSISKNIESVNTIGGVLRRCDNQLDILKLIFNFYRAEFARKREDYLLSTNKIESGKYFYKPLPDRSRFLEIIHNSHFNNCKLEDEIDEQVQSGWLRLHFNEQIDRPLVPLPFSLALSKLKKNKTASRIDFFRAALDLSVGDSAKQLQRAHSMIPNKIVGCNPNTFPDDIAVDLVSIKENKKKNFSIGDTRLIQFIIEIGVFIPLALYEPITALGATIPIYKITQWQCRKSKRIAKAYYQAMTNLQSHKDIEAIYLNVFKRNIPKC